MNKREKAIALAVRHEMVQSGITANQILRFATPAEVHGFWKGVFCPSARPANLYTLVARIRARQRQTIVAMAVATVSHSIAQLSLGL
ncbi:MAG: hypothetical protein Q8L21_02030 [Candidatus Komeilibacteria bacterium]|nr:hypothetical protein [Candidatus Komeilibacteria bacterium]